MRGAFSLDLEKFAIFPFIVARIAHVLAGTVYVVYMTSYHQFLLVSQLKCFLLRMGNAEWDVSLPTSQMGT